MKFLIDAQLPRRLAYALQNAGHDTVHTLDLPLKNRTPDNDIVLLAQREDRIVVTKDSDFVHSHLLRGQPQKLLLISTGNITNRELDSLFILKLDTLESLFEMYNFVELSRTAIVIHK